MTDPEHVPVETVSTDFKINKQLGWSIVVVSCGLIWFGATTITQLQASVGNLLDQRSREEDDARNMHAHLEQSIDNLQVVDYNTDVRLRALENVVARQDTKLDTLSESLNEVKTGQNQMNQLLRTILEKGSASR